MYKCSLAFSTTIKSDKNALIAKWLEANRNGYLKLLIPIYLTVLLQKCTTEEEAILLFPFPTILIIFFVIKLNIKNWV